MGGKRGGGFGWSLGHRKQTRDALCSFLEQITKGNPAYGTNGTDINVFPYFLYFWGG